MVVSRQQYLELYVKMEELSALVHMVISHLQLSWEVVFPPPPLTSDEFFSSLQGITYQANGHGDGIPN